MPSPSGTGAAPFPDREWTPYGADHPPSVLLVIDHRAPSRSATLRASRLASSFDARLKILDIVPRQLHHPPGTTPIASASAMLGRAHCDVEVLYGDLSSTVIGRAREYESSLIVLGGATTTAQACELVDELHLPVILAREARPSGRFLAASDMQHVTLPVLRTALELSRRCARDLTLFHNANPTVTTDEPACRYASMTDLVEAALAAKTARLHGLAGTSDHVEAVIARASTTESAILDLVRERDIDLVILGRRTRSWLGRVLGHRVTERIVARCTCSVMIVPIEATA